MSAQKIGFGFDGGHAVCAMLFERLSTNAAVTMDQHWFAELTVISYYGNLNSYLVRSVHKFNRFVISNFDFDDLLTVTMAT